MSKQIASVAPAVPSQDTAEATNAKTLAACLILLSPYLATAVTELEKNKKIKQEKKDEALRSLKAALQTTQNLLADK